MFVSKESIMMFINFGLNDIYSFEGRGWSFMYRENETITIPTSEDKSYVHTTTYPLYRLVSIYDNHYKQFLAHKDMKQTNLKIDSEGMLYYLPFTTAFTIFNNTEGYELAYLGWFNDITADSEQLPIPNAFAHALYDFVMAYILPVYAQAGENRENVSYQRGVAKLTELKKADDIQFNKISFNIK